MTGRSSTAFSSGGARSAGTGAAASGGSVASGVGRADGIVVPSGAGNEPAGRSVGEEADGGVGSGGRATLVTSPPTAGPPVDTAPAANPSDAVIATTATDSTAAM